MNANEETSADTTVLETPNSLKRVTYQVGEMRITVETTGTLQELRAILALAQEQLATSKAAP